MIFPTICDDRALAQWISQREALRHTVQAFLDHEGLAYTQLVSISGGTNVLYDLGQGRVLKLCPPLLAEDAATELAVLQAPGLGSLGLEVPGLLRHGQTEGWTWMILSRLSGVCGWDAWEVMDAQERRRAAQALGAWAAAFYRDASVQAAEVPAGRRSWDKTWRWLRGDVVQKHRRCETSQAWLDRVEPALEGWSPQGSPRLIHADLHPGNLLFTQTAQGWALTGVLDFADATWAPALYDLAAPALYLAEGDFEVTQLLARALWGQPCPVPEVWRWILLHQFSGLAWCVREAKLADGDSMEALAHALLGRGA